MSPPDVAATRANALPTLDYVSKNFTIQVERGLQHPLMSSAVITSCAGMVAVTQRDPPSPRHTGHRVCQGAGDPKLPRGESADVAGTVAFVVGLPLPEPVS